MRRLLVELDRRLQDGDAILWDASAAVALLSLSRARAALTSFVLGLSWNMVEIRRRRCAWLVPLPAPLGIIPPNDRLFFEWCDDGAGDDVPDGNTPTGGADVGISAPSVAFDVIHCLGPSKATRPPRPFLVQCRLSAAMLVQRGYAPRSIAPHTRDKLSRVVRQAKPLATTGWRANARR